MVSLQPTFFQCPILHRHPVSDMTLNVSHTWLGPTAFKHPIISFIRLSPLLHQELRCREEELKRAALEQKSHEEFLRQREQQLAQWEQDVFERELTLLILHLNQNQEKPNVKKRKGTFKKHKLKCKNGEKISMPQGVCVCLNC